MEELTQLLLKVEGTFEIVHISSNNIYTLIHRRNITLLFTTALSLPRGDHRENVLLQVQAVLLAILQKSRHTMKPCLWMA